MSHILIVDDELDYVRMLETALEASGFEVSVAFDGRSGFEAVLERQPDLVVTDVVMPEMDGLDFIKAVSQVDPELPIILVSGVASDEQIEACRELGADVVIRKPFNLDQLEKEIRRLMT